MSKEDKKLEYSYVFEREEVKYILNDEQYTEFLNKTKQYIETDEYGLSLICNIYFDTDNYEMVRTSIEKPIFKEKLRLRSYGLPNEDTTVFIELKRKYKGTVYKRRIDMPLKKAEAYLYNGVYPNEYDCQVLREIDYLIKFYNPKPCVYLAYDRIAYNSIEDRSVRITLDSCIRSRTTNLNLSYGDIGTYLSEAEEGFHLLEVKVVNAIPIWLVEILSEIKIYPYSFSKYGEIYKKIIIPSSKNSNYNLNEKEEKKGNLECLTAY